MPGKTKAQSFELAAFRPSFEAARYAILFAALAASAVFAMLSESYVAVPLLLAFYFGGFGLQVWMDRVRPTLTMGADGFSIRSRAEERFVAWTDFVRFEKAPRGLIAITQDGWVPLGRTGVTFDEALKRLIREQPRETLKQLEEAAQHWRQERAKPRILHLFEAHDEAQWPTILEKAAQSDFRTSGITQSHLCDDLLNPDTPPGLRELLAKTLPIRVEESDVAEAIEAFASERSKEVLRSRLADAD